MPRMKTNESRTAISHFSDLLCPGGHLFVTVPNFKSCWNIIEWTLDKFKLVPPLHGEQHVCRYTPKTISSAINQAGFEILECGTFNFVSPFVSCLSQRLGEKLLKVELKYLRRGGNLIFVHAVKK